MYINYYIVTEGSKRDALEIKMHYKIIRFSLNLLLPRAQYIVGKVMSNPLKFGH